MTDWERVKQDLEAAGYPGFTFNSGDACISELSGEWISGWIPREEGLKHENQPLLIRVWDTLPGGAVDANPENAPEIIRDIASQHGLEVMIIAVSADEARIAVCDLSKGE
jgi:hypothetical protein